MEDLENVLKSRVIEEKNYGDSRDSYLRDRDRIIFSRSFRRLAFKTQVVPVLGGITSDHIRSRLTHSLEVMQIASSIALEVNKKFKNNDTLNIDLIQAIAVGHDIGHTAYGHIGEEALFKFIFNSNNGRNFEYLGNKVRHSFQSLKVCCFLEKQYKPDFYGLNLTIATLDGILKHSYLKEKERRFYKGIFDSYQEIFLNYKNVDIKKKEQFNEILFEYVSPLTYEGIIVSIADEIAQLCHDVEDIRRLGGFKAVRDFYEIVNENIGGVKEYLPIQEVFNDFSKIFKLKYDDDQAIKLERLYIKLILGICIQIVSKVIKILDDMDEVSRDQLLRKKYFGEFKNLKEPELGLNKNEIKLIDSLEEIFKEYRKTLFALPEVARWDIKGRELCEELSDKLYKAFNYKVTSQNNEINLNILDYKIREDIKKSSDAGKMFEKYPLDNVNEIDGIPIKFAVWDYLAGMTDSFIIKEYESLTFKRVELR